jgi:pyrimidine operon attenuation protein / uracil phosphoribosyltransferase
MAIEILSAAQTEVCIRRLALQVREAFADAPHLNLIAIAPRGIQVLEALLPLLAQGGLKLYHAKYSEGAIQDSNSLVPAPNAPLLVVDDVLNTGHTLFQAVQAVGSLVCSGIQVLVLVDRGHRKWPVAADFVGLRLATTLQEYVRIDVQQGPSPAMVAYLD